MRVKTCLLEVVIQMYITWTPLKRSSARQQTNKLIGNKLRLYFLTSELVCKSRIEGPCTGVGRSGQGHPLPLSIVHRLYSTHREGWADLQEQQPLVCKSNPNPWQSPAFFTDGNDWWRCPWSCFGRWYTLRDSWRASALRPCAFAFHQGHFAQVFLCKFGAADMQMKAQLHFASPLIFS